jgi:hypothetical protein
MTWSRTLVSAVVVAVGAVLVPGVVQADVVQADVMTPELDAPCSVDLGGVMTLLPDEQTYVICQEEMFARYVWRAAPVPFEPNSTWLSYGPAITLHGQGMRNPNLSSGQWTATPLDPATVCRVQQETVVEAGVLSAPKVFQGDPGQPLSVEMLPQLFYAQLSGHCLWTED